MVELVEAVRSLDYGRPSDRSVEGMMRERRGTCSTKHLFLAEALEERFPETEPQIVHRVYRLDRDRARELFGERVADAVPEEGLIDVHRHLTVVVGDRRVVIDATFPGAPWDGRSWRPFSVPAPGRTIQQARPQRREACAGGRALRSGGARTVHRGACQHSACRLLWRGTDPHRSL